MIIANLCKKYISSISSLLYSSQSCAFLRSLHFPDFDIPISYTSNVLIVGILCRKEIVIRWNHCHTVCDTHGMDKWISPLTRWSGSTWNKFGPQKKLVKVDLCHVIIAHFGATRWQDDARGLDYKMVALKTAPAEQSILRIKTISTKDHTQTEPSKLLLTTIGSRLC